MAGRFPLYTDTDVGGPVVKALRSAGIRVGNYTGRYDPADPGASAASGTKAMGEAHGVSNHEAQQEDPPDILLTNYKMLDYLLLRPQDQRLWRFNEPGVLQYLVLDELHTYDGAQGADVACLIRRLKERLEIPKGELCVVGTSATLDAPPRSDSICPMNALSLPSSGFASLCVFDITLTPSLLASYHSVVRPNFGVEESGLGARRCVSPR